MIKTPLSSGRLAACVFFTLSCFGLLVFLWTSFGGSLPLQPRKYQVQVSFPEAVSLVGLNDVRLAGVTVGKVRSVRRDPAGNRALATLELDAKYAPLPADTRAALRSKTLLGEAYVQLAFGSRAGPTVPEGGHLADARVADAVQLDEVLDTLDRPTRRHLERWTSDLATAIDGRDEELGAALATLAPFTTQTGKLLGTLAAERGALRRLVGDAGTVFDAASAQTTRLRALATSTDTALRAVASEDDALADTVAVLPTFLAETEATSKRLERLAGRAAPLVRELTVGTRELAPAIAEAKAFAPDLERSLRALTPVAAAARSGLPAIEELAKASGPLLDALHPFLGELNPVLRWLETNQYLVADFLSNGEGALADTVNTGTPGAVGHYLRQLSPIGPESVGLYAERPAAARGNAYLAPTLELEKTFRRGIFPSFDCKPAGGERERDDDGPDRQPACFEAAPVDFGGRAQGRYPHVEAESYLTPAPRRRP